MAAQGIEQERVVVITDCSVTTGNIVLVAWHNLKYGIFIIIEDMGSGRRMDRVTAKVLSKNLQNI